MGKRELILIAAFVILGGIVYQATAPPPAPGARGFSFGRFLDDVRREVRGNRGFAQRTSTAVQPIDAAVREVRVTLRRGPITIVGEQRSDVSAELVASSNGSDDAEAQRLVEQTNIKFDLAGSILFVSIAFPEPGAQRVRSLALKVPSRLVVRVAEGNTGQLEISSVAGVELDMARGKTILRQISGHVTASHRGGDFMITDAASLRLTARGSDVSLAHIRGEATITTQAGDLTSTGIAGPIELDSNATDVRLEALETTTGKVRVKAAGGSIALLGLRSDSRIDIRNADLDVVVDRPAVIAIYSEGAEPVDVALPRGGFQLDALTRQGRIRTTPDDLLAGWGLDVAGAPDGGEQKVSGRVNGGGPLLTIRTQGSLTLAAPEHVKQKTSSNSKP